MNRLLFCLAVVFACSPVKGKPLLDAEILSVDSMKITPSPLTERVGLDTQQLSVMAMLSDGTTRDVTNYVTWSSSATTIVLVPLGVVTPVHAGMATVTATLGTATATADVTVRDPIIAVGSEPNGATPAGIDFFDAFGSGNIAPIRSIRGTNTDLSETFEMFADGSNNELYVADEGTGVYVFPLDGSGNIPALRHIPAGSASQLIATFSVQLSDDESTSLRSARTAA